MGWNCPACLNGDLASPTLRLASPLPFSPAPPPPTPPPLACSDLRDSSLPLPSHPPLLNTYPPSAFTLPASSPPPTGSQSVHILPPHTQGNPRPSQNLCILQWNAGGLPSSRRAELIAFLSGNHYDLIFLQETHLSSTKKFQIPGYYTLRTDRTFGRQGPVSSATHNTGGGVLTLIHSDLAFSPVSVSSLSSQDPYSDYTCVKVLLSNHSPLQFFNLYFPPIRNTPSDYRTRTFCSDILPNSPDTFILGDFNAHHPTWDRLIPPNPLGNDLFRWITSSGLEILNDPASPTLLHHSTGSRSSPDISLAPASLAPHCEWRTLPGFGSNHLPIEIVPPLSPVRLPNTRPPKFNYKKASWDIYQSYIAEHLPSLDFDALNIHQAAHSFSLFLVEAAKASIPFGHLGRSPKAWWSQEAESAVRERRRARSVAHRSESHRLRYIDASRRASSVISRAKSATWQATCSNLSPRSDPRAVFRLLNAISGKKNTSHDPSFPDCTSPLDTANHYASYLRSHLSQATPRSSRRAERQFMNELRKASCEDASSLHNSFCSPFSLNELSTAISNLSASTASGPDQIAYPLLKHLPEPAQLLLLSLFNRSWHSHTFPSCWKPSTIIPIHKPGKPTSSPSSFCPISLTSCISKLFERLILSRLTFHLESNHLLSTCQAGFRPGRSSLDQILTLYQSIWDGFQKKKPPDRTILASVDFSKAFDSVWHSALFHKLLSLKLPPCFVLWVRSFLSDRRAKVQVGGSHSRSFRIRRGVPQGSVLGPVLFILFVDDITKDLPRDAHASLYADDLAIWSSFPDPLKAFSVVQSSLAVLETWSNLWRLPLNPKKCESSFFSTLPLNPKKCESSFFSTDPHQATFQPRLNLLGFPLLFNPTPKFLGVTFDRTLSFGAHVQSLCSKFYPRHKALRSIATASWGPTKESLSLLYKAFVRPVLTYASPGWFPFLCNTATNHLEVLHSCMQGHYWLPLFHPLLTTPSRGPTPSSKADSRASDPILL